MVFVLVLAIGLSTAVPAGLGGSPGTAGTAYAAPGSERDPGSIPSKDEVDQARKRASDAAGEAGRIEAQVAAANAQLRRLDQRFQTAVEDYNLARYELQQADRAAAAAKSRAVSARRAVEEKRRAIGGLAARTYQQSGSAGLPSLLSASGPRELIDRAARVRQASDAAAADYQGLQAARAVATVLDRQAAAARERRQVKAAAADAAKERAEQALAEQDRAVAAVERRKNAQLARLAELRHTSVQLARDRQAGLEELARKRAEERRRKAAAEAARRAREAVARERARDRERGSEPGSDSGGSGESGPSRGQASRAIGYALAQVGEPYVFGAAGPGTWDCSGLTMRAWARAGVYLPHFARGQYWQSRHISLGELRPGDLIFWANNPGDSNTIHHVGMYLGNGRMVHAPRPGRDVEIQSMWYMGTPTHYARP